MAGDLIEVLPYKAEIPRRYSFTGRNGAGSVALVGALVGDVVSSIVGLTTVGNASALFETTITVANQIQQVSATELSAKNYLVDLVHTS